MKSEEAFECLINLAQKANQELLDSGAAYFTNGDTAHVRETADRVERIQTVINAFVQLKNLWEKAIPVDLPIFPPDPNENQHQRTPPGMRTPQDRYWLPILQTLSDLGCKGHTHLVLDRVGIIMANILNDIDLGNLPTRDEPRWRNTASWVRLDMVKAGYLSDRSPNGTWEITEEGRKYLKNRSL
jgi:hypothetical protein